MSCTLTPEQRARIGKKNIANNLAIRFLLPVGMADKEDAFEGLKALCWTAKGNVCVYPTNSELWQGLTIPTLTWLCIEDAILEVFAPYHDKSVDEILDVVAADKFRYIGRKVRGMLVDEIRRRCAVKNKDVPTIHPNPNADDDGKNIGWSKLEEITAAPSAQLNSGTDTARKETSDTYTKFIETHKTALTKEVGKVGVELLEETVRQYPDLYEKKGIGEIKSALTLAIQRRRGVSERMAQTNKQDTLDKVQAAIRGGSKVLSDLHGLVGKGDDETTLRFDFPRKNGMGNRSIVMRRLKFH